MKTTQAALAEIREQFRAAGLETPDLDARLLAQAALGVNHEELLLNYSLLVTESESKKLTEMTARRLQREPVSRIIGMRGFWRSDFKVSRETLDPRADSEVIIEMAMKYSPKDKPVTIADLGTGTGCLLLSLLQELPQARGIGIDISADAIQTAKENAGILSLSDRSSFEISSWTSLTAERPFDIVISNPPYIAENEIPELAPEVRRYDPIRALSGGADGLNCYREIAALLPRLVTKTGHVFLEIGATQAEAVKEILAVQGFGVLKVARDLGGHNRCIVAQAL